MRPYLSVYIRNTPVAIALALAMSVFPVNALALDLLPNFLKDYVDRSLP